KEDQHSFLCAKTFSSYLRHQEQRMQLKTTTGTVTEIKRRGAGDYILRVKLFGKEGPLEEIPAARIDFCIGSGPVRFWPDPEPDGESPISVELRNEYRDLGNLTSPRRVVPAEDFLGMPKEHIGERVCVVGDGATAAWCVEVAHKRGAKGIVWIGRRFST